jgi:hypothetical protein
VDAGSENKIEPPSKFKRALKRGEQEKKSRGSRRAFSMVVSKQTQDNHYAGSSPKTGSDLAAEWELCAVKNLGDEDKYVKAWPLHYYLDYIDQNTAEKKTIRELIQGYRSYHSSDLHSTEVEETLIERQDEVSEEVGIKIE